jgi:aminoglycoside phosphotransferase (APT) family kinase protein
MSPAAPPDGPAASRPRGPAPGRPRPGGGAEEDRRRKVRSGVIITYRESVTEAVSTAVRAHLPGYRIRSVEKLGSGLENTAYVVNRDLVVRFPHQPDPAAIANEVALIRRVWQISPLPVPQVVFHDDVCLAYKFMKGRPLQPEDMIDVEELGELLRRLHAIPVEDVRHLVKEDHDPLQQWLDEAAELYRRHESRLTPHQRSKIEAFLAETPPAQAKPDRLVFSHNDLGIEHVLVDRGKITGIIDWSDAAICDPAYDYGLLIRDLGEKAPDPPPDCEARALFYAKCSAIEDFDYGLDRGMRWLF